LETYYLSLVRGDKRGLWPALQRGGLRVLSGPYGLAMRCRNWLFDAGWKRRIQAPIPVISVGNLTMGGTGKTPCVELVARFLRERDVRVAILSRGYGNRHGCNDEALVLEENLPDVPHLQGADRAALAQIAAEELDSEVLVLDDGFQHRRLMRDLDLVLIDATVPWGFGLFPRGTLREPPSSLRRAHMVILTRCDQVGPGELAKLRACVKGIAPRLPIAESNHVPAGWINRTHARRPLEELRNRPLAAFCGIGNPEAFRRTLTLLGTEPMDFRIFPDHHPYTRNDVEDLRTWARQLATDCVVVTTQKDLVKLRLDRIGDRQLWALEIRLQVGAGRDALEEKLEKFVVSSS
jgi:tetraacyldisaccharide 4'-kinase